ncbi:MAG TPA: GGDEF domain-containing protein, partial [Terriglobales bacterium]
YGGEEFVIVLPETSHQGAMLVANRLRRSVETAPFFAGSPDLRTNVTISIGVSVYSRDARFKRDLMEAADAALYEAKERGRNRVISYSEITRRKEVS